MYLFLGNTLRYFGHDSLQSYDGHIVINNVGYSNTFFKTYMHTFMTNTILLRPRVNYILKKYINSLKFRNLNNILTLNFILNIGKLLQKRLNV